MKTITILFLIFFFSCTESNIKPDKQILDFGSFTIEVPKSWIKIKKQGIDSYTGEIAIDAVDTIGFDLGAWSNPLTEEQPIIWGKSSLSENFVIDTTRVFLVDDSKGIDPDKYRKQTLTWDTIDGREAKIVYPRKSGRGITGVYIDSLWTRKFDIDRFNLYGKDLRPANELEFLKAIKTIKFHERK